MRGYTPTNTNSEIRWSTLSQLFPYLAPYPKRIFFALVCLVIAKIANITLPFVLKHIIDDLDQQNVSAQLLSIPLGLLIAYGAVRLSSVVIAEVRDTIFGRVTEKAMHAISLKIFKHLHTLDLDFHLDRKTGGLSRDIERGTTGIGFLLRFMVFNIVPTLLEIIMVMAILVFNYDIWWFPSKM